MTHAIKLQHPTRITASAEGQPVRKPRLLGGVGAVRWRESAHGIQRITKGHPLRDKDVEAWDFSGCSPAGHAYACRLGSQPDGHQICRVLGGHGVGFCGSMLNLDAILEIWGFPQTTNSHTPNRPSFSGVRFAVVFEMQYKDSAMDWSRTSKFT